MPEKIYTRTDRRHDFIILFDVVNGNPNGDPDAGNLPRVDPETMNGLVTDVCIKRKIRDWVDDTQGFDNGRMKIYVQHGAVLLDSHERAYVEIGEGNTKNKKKPPVEVKEKARKWMCENFFDVRMFGAVMTLGINCGQVRGPLQFTFAQSIDPVTPLDLSITRVAVTKLEELSEEEGETPRQTMGRKTLVPYGLYRGFGFYNPNLGRKTGVTEEDLDIFWKALINMWELDRSAARGLMACRGLYIFTHESPYGDAPAHQLFNLVGCERKSDVSAPRDFGNYTISIDETKLPDNISLTRLVG